MYYYLTRLNLPETKDKIVIFFILNTFLKSKIQLLECIRIELYITVHKLFFFGFLPIFFTVYMLHQYIQAAEKWPQNVSREAVLSFFFIFLIIDYLMGATLFYVRWKFGLHLSISVYLFVFSFLKSLSLGVTQIWTFGQVTSKCQSLGTLLNNRSWLYSWI